MLTATAAGVLRLSVLLLAGGAIAGGFLLYAGTRGDSADPRIEVVLSPTPGVASTPTLPVVQVAPTATLALSEWKTYESPEGFSLRYPPTWTLVVFPAPDFNPPGVDSADSVWLMDPQFARARAEALEANGGLPAGFEPPAGSMKIEIAVLPSTAQFDAAVFAQFCEAQVEVPEGGTGLTRAESIDVAGARGVACDVQAGSSDQPAIPILRWVELADGGVLRLQPGLVGSPGDGLQTIHAILASLAVGS